MIRRSRRTFTMIEVMVAAAILLIAIMGTIGAMAVAGNLRFSTRQGEAATAALQAVLEEYRTLAPSAVQTQAATENSVALNDGDSRALGNNRIKNVYVPSERETRLLLPADLNFDGSIGAADTYDLDGDGTADQTDGASDRTQYHQQDGNLVPILIRIQWGRARPLPGKPILTAVHDTTPSATQVIGIPGTMNITREFYVEIVTFIYPLSTSS